MLGLLIKDFLTLKKYLKTMLFTLLIYAVWGYIAGDPSFLISCSIVLFAMVTVTSIAYDEQCHWNNYALTMPLKYNTLVLSKYTLGILLCLLGTVISLTGAVFLSAIIGSLTGMFEKLLVTAVVGIMIGLLFISIYLPFVFKLGAEKSRMIMVSIFLVPTVIIGIIYKTAPEVINTILNALSILETNPTGAFISVTIGVLVMLIISFFISLSIFKKKEF